MYNYNLQNFDCQLYNELKMNRIRYPLSPTPKKGGSETLIRSYTSKTDILSMKIYYKVIVSNISHKVHILPLMPP